MRFAFLVLLLATLAWQCRAEDWPQFRGPGGQGVSREKSAPLTWSSTENIAWKTTIPGEGWSSPIAYKDRLFVTTAMENGRSLRLLCINKVNGSILWNREVQRQSPTRMHALNSSATATPATDGENVFVLGTDGAITAVSYRGDILWVSRDVKYYSEHGLGTSPILYQNLVIVAYDGSSDGTNPEIGWHIPWDGAVIAAVDKRTGKTAWHGKRGLSRLAHCVPAIARVNGADQLVSGAGDVIQGHNLRNGELIWTAKSAGDSLVPSVVVGDGLVYGSSGFGSPAIIAVRPDGHGDASSTRVAWTVTKAAPTVPSYLYVQPYLYTIAESGAMQCLKADTGELVWSQRVGGSFSTSPVYVAGKIYLLSDQGDCQVIRAGDKYSELARNKMGEQCRAGLAVSGGRIYLRTKSALYCIGPK